MPRSTASDVLPGGRIRRPSPLRLADRRGLTALGAALLASAVGGAGAAVDLSTGSTFTLVFAGAFAAGCVLAVLLAHTEDVRAVAVMPPLVYLFLVAAGGSIDASAGSGSLPTRLALGLVNALILGAPVLVGTTVLTALLALLRRAGSH